MAINNLSPNPSFEVDLTGYTALPDTQIVQDQTWAQYGQSAMLVQTSGLVPGEGFTGPVVINGGSPTTGAVSLNFLSPAGASGTVTFEVIDASTLTVLGSTTVTLDGNEVFDTRAAVTFSLAASQHFQLEVATSSVQALTFWVDGCQYETGVSSASPYIDGDQPGCSWNGTPGLSSSTQLYANATGASGAISIFGRATPVLIGATFSTSASGKIVLSGSATPGAAAVPVGAFTDFSLFGLTDLDPAQTYADQNNAGASTGQTNYASGYGIFVPPVDYPVSGGNFAWKRAAYMGVGFYLTGMPANNEQNITDIEVSLAPMGMLTPPAYTSPRQIATIIKPTRLNYCTNPSFEVSTAGWTGVGTGTVAQDNTTVPTPAYSTLLTAGNLGNFFTNAGITIDGSTGFGGMDGTNTYSENQLTIAGAGVGAVISSGGINYMMPAVAANTPDSIRCQGQIIPLTGITDATLVGILGSSVFGDHSGTVTITYTDGTTSTPTLGLTDWALNGGTTASFGNQIAVTTPYRNISNGATLTGTACLLTATLPVTAGKKIASITLPNVPDMRIFGISLAKPTGNTTGLFSGKVTVNANLDGIQIAVPDLIVGDPYTVSMFVQAGTALSAITAAAGAAIPGITGSGSGAVTGIAGANIVTGIWNPLSFSFLATSSTSSEIMTIRATGGTGVVYPTSFWADGILIEAGEVVNPYFDGSFTGGGVTDYQWEGTAGLSRSYYYQQLGVKKFSIQEILNQHIPLGLTAPAPQYTVPPTQ